jgi:hypothetical protein
MTKVPDDLLDTVTGAGGGRSWSPWVELPGLAQGALQRVGTDLRGNHWFQLSMPGMKLKKAVWMSFFGNRNSAVHWRFPR